MFLNKIAKQKDRLFHSIHPDAIRVLEAHPWNGNIRELQNTIEYAVLLYDDTELKPEHLNIIHGKSSEDERNRPSRSYPFLMELPEEGFDLEELSLEIIRKVLTMFDGNQTKVARYLGMSRYAMRSRLNKL